MKSILLKIEKQFFFIAFVIAATAACSGQDALTKSIFHGFKNSGQRSIDLDRAVPGAWQRVCMLGPYTDNAATQAALGFQWDSEKVSNVAMDDTIVLLVFVDSNDKVAFFTNYPRGKGDFSNLSRQCFDRSHARFEQVSRPQRGWPGLFPEPATNDAVN